MSFLCIAHISPVRGAMLQMTQVRQSSIKTILSSGMYHAVRGASNKQSHSSVFARPTIDVAFKQMLVLDEENRPVVTSFLEAFTGRKIAKVMTVSDALPALKRDIEEKQTFLDLACREPDGSIFLTEVQVKKQNYWDARALYYLSGVYSRQLTPDQKWHHLQPVVGINILDHETGTMDTNEFEKKFAFIDKLYIERAMRHKGTFDLKNNGKAILEWMSLYQVELPRVDLNRVKNAKKKEWLRLFTTADTLTEIPKGTSDAVAEAYHRLEIKKWNGALIRDYEKDKLDLSNYSMALREERSEGIAEGEKAKAIEIARGMLAKKMEISLVAELTGLTADEINELK